MGAVTFSVDPRLIDALKKILTFSVFIETGTFKGDTAAAMGPLFDTVVTVELSEALAAQAVRRFSDNPTIHVLQGDSAFKLSEIRSDMEGVSALYWLDAHWCVATDTEGVLSQCPLIGELKAIRHLNDLSVILIDDARLFLAPPLAPHEISHWPSFHQIVMQLLAMNPRHELMVVNDVIAFFPASAKHALVEYSQNFGINWLDVANSYKEEEPCIHQLVAKEAVIQESLLKIQDLETQLLDKQRVIEGLALALSRYRAALYLVGPLLRPIGFTVNHARLALRPRLGILNQYPAKPIDLASLCPQPKLYSTGLAISIVTPSYGQGRFIERTIQSVLNQSYPRLQYFVQDGGSTDETVQIIGRYEAQLDGWVSENDSGQSQAINRGFAKTSGDIMGWLNSDDLLLPNALHTVAAYFEKHPDVDVVYGNRLLIDEQDQEIGRWMLPGHCSKVLSWADYIPQETLFWRRRIWERVGGQIDESFRFAMDWDLLIRFREAGAKFAHIPEFLGAFRIHEHQKTSASINEVGHQEMDRIRKRVLGYQPNYKEIRNNVAGYLFRHVAIELAHRIRLRLRGAS